MRIVPPRLGRLRSRAFPLVPLIGMLTFAGVLGGIGMWAETALIMRGSP
jgi:hypothetical protein